jgi:deazaflavin-dependent oxidoreductase (nitroreductase family)
MGWPISDRSARAMYAGGRGNATARRLSRFWSAAFAAGLFPRRGVTLEVTGRRSGGATRFPLIAVDVHGAWYLVSMLGEDCNWVRNVRAAGGRAVVVRRRRRHRQLLVEVPVAERAPILKRYLAHAPGGRPHVPVEHRAPVDDFGAVAARYPVFRIDPLPREP